MELINLDKQNFDFCSLRSESHIENSLGSPMSLPPAIQESLDSGESEENLLQLFKLIKGCEYERVIRDNTYNHETDLDQFFVYSVYAPLGSSDWIWQRDCFVLIDMGYPGDPRYVEYKTSQVYDLGDSMLGEVGFFSWTLGWYARYISDGETSNETDPIIEGVNERISEGYSSNPTYELRELCYADPIWVENLKGYVGRVKDTNCPMVFCPTEPCYN